MGEMDAAWHRLLSAGKVRWMPGMAARHPLHAGGMRVEVIDCDWISNGHAYVRAAAATPIWTDPATLGCLLAMAREAWGGKPLHCAHMGEPFPGRGPLWLVWQVERAYGATEAEALLAAIEAAPDKGAA